MDHAIFQVAEPNLIRWTWHYYFSSLHFWPKAHFYLPREFRFFKIFVLTCYKRLHKLTLFFSGSAVVPERKIKSTLNPGHGTQQDSKRFNDFCESCDRELFRQTGFRFRIDLKGRKPREFIMTRRGNNTDYPGSAIYITIFEGPSELRSFIIGNFWLRFHRPKTQARFINHLSLT